MVVGFSSKIRGAYQSDSPSRPLLFYPLVCSLLVTSGFMLWGFHAIITSKSSTAGIGFFILPLYSIAVAVAGLLVSWSVLYVIRFVIERLGIIPGRITSVAPLALAIALLVLTGYVVQNRVARYRLLNEATSGTDVDSLATILADGIASRDLEVLSKLAKNPNMPTDDLVRLYDFCKPTVGKLGGSYSQILHPLAQNPRTPPDILAVLASCQQSWIRDSVAVNPKTPTSTLRQLTEDQESYVKGHAQRELRLRENGERSEKE